MMDKPLKDWTLGELQEYCSNTDCQNACWLYARDTFCPFLGEVPGDWNLSDPSRWTAEDIADAKAVKRLFPYVDKVYRDSDGRVVIMGSGLSHYLGENAYPTLQMGETVTLQEILDAEGQEN